MFIVIQGLDCDDGEVYVAVTKRSTSSGSEEKYQILNGTTVLKEGTWFPEGESTSEYCLTATTNNQYSIKLRDGYRDSWKNGAWVSVAGEYGNVVLKTMMVESSEELFALSLYYPVKKNEEWRMTSSIVDDWMDVDFDDEGWSAVTLGSVSAVSGTQYFRKTFTGLPNMAAYEVSMNYQFGIIAYVNGVEEFRDHMEEGEVTAATPSIGAFETYEYHGFIRPAGEIESLSVLAVELHFPTTGENAVEFDAFVASLASSTPVTENSNCYVYPYEVTLSATGGRYPESIFSFHKTYNYQFDWGELPLTVTYALGGPRMHVNGVRVWPFSTSYYPPVVFTLSGGMNASSSFTDVVSVTRASYISNKYKTIYGRVNAKPFQLYNLMIYSHLSAYEVQPVTCNQQLPTTVVFNPSSYTVHLNYERVSIRPENPLVADCAISPSLPTGLTLDATTCTISGIATVTMPSTVFTMTSEVGGIIEGTFTLEVVVCSGMWVRLYRVYKSNAANEWFSVKDMATGDVVMGVAANAGQMDNTDGSESRCLTGSRYEISVGSSDPSWPDGSYLYMYAMLSNSDWNQIARIYYDSLSGLAESYEIHTQWSVAPYSQWFYKMSEVPAAWYDADTEGWNTGSMGTFPASGNQIQLYKKTFTIADLSEVAGFQLSLRYKYGCVIYMNGVEAFRNGVSDELSVNSLSSITYNNLYFHHISLPARTIAVGDTPAVNYLVEGANTLAIALVAAQSSQRGSDFECAVHLMFGDSLRMLDYSTNGGISNSRDSFMGACGTYWEVIFNNDRREWVNSIDVYLQYQQYTQQPVQFVLKALNNIYRDEWTILKNVTDMTWSLTGEHKRIWLENNKPWNRYRFDTIDMNVYNCRWKVGGFNLLSTSTPSTIPDLAYETPLVFFLNSETQPVYPTWNYYSNFTVSPALPAGLLLDFYTGMISGVATELSEERTYTITAQKVGGGNTTTTVTLSVVPCFGERSLITLVTRIDRYPLQGSYKLFAGKGTSGPVVASNPGFNVEYELKYVSWCLPHGIYTLELYDSEGDGWRDSPSWYHDGWYLSVDGDAMIFEMGQVPSGVSSVSTVFSSLLPFQIEYDSWKMWNSVESVAVGWNEKDFDDAGWETKKAVELGNHVSTTAYVRHEVLVPSLEDYHVLNIRMKYAGGVAAYFNGHLVARFNLEEKFGEETEAMGVHNATLFSKFHVILPTVGAVVGSNAIAFEIHRAAGENAIVFDATGVFGVNECSVTVDSFSAIDSRSVSQGTKEIFLDLDPTSYGYISNVAGSFLSWTVENLEGSKCNSFALETVYARTGYGFSMKGRWESSEEYMNALTMTDQSTKNRGRSAWSMPIGHASFSQLRFVVDKAASYDVHTNAFVMQYCVPSGEGACAADGAYPSVKNGEMSVARCPKFMTSYTYRMCNNGVLGEVQQECHYKQPTHLAYPHSPFGVFAGTPFSSGVPTYGNFISSFEVIEGALPSGLTLNASTGEISGETAGDDCSVTIKGSNADASTTVTVSFQTVTASIVYPTIGSGVHVVVGEATSLTPTISLTPDSFSFTAFEAVNLPEGLTIDNAGVISGTVGGAKRSVEVTVKGFIGASFFPVTFTLFVDGQGSVLVPEGASPSHTLRLRARRAIASVSLYLDSEDSEDTLALTGLSMAAGEVRSVFAALPDSTYTLLARNLDIIVLRDTHPVAAFIGEDVVSGQFSTTPVCEESSDVECAIVEGTSVIVKEVSAESASATSAIIPLNRAKSYEM